MRGGSHGLIRMTAMSFENIQWMDAYKILAAYLPRKALRRKWTATSHRGGSDSNRGGSPLNFPLSFSPRLKGKVLKKNFALRALLSKTRNILQITHSYKIHIKKISSQNIFKFVLKNAKQGPFLGWKQVLVLLSNKMEIGKRE